MLVRHLMTRDVFSTSPEETCLELLRVFAERRIRRAPVVEEGAVIAMVTRDDLLRLFPATHDQLADADQRFLRTALVRTAMSKGIRTVAPEEPLERAADLMRVFKIGALPVVEQGTLVGIVTESDMFRVLARGQADDDTLRVTLETPGGGSEEDELDVLALCAGLQLLLTSYARFDASSSEGEAVILHVLHVRGAGRGALPARLREAGVRVLEISASELSGPP